MLHSGKKKLNEPRECLFKGLQSKESDWKAHWLVHDISTVTKHDKWSCKSKKGTGHVFYMATPSNATDSVGNDLDSLMCVLWNGKRPESSHFLYWEREAVEKCHLRRRSRASADISLLPFGGTDQYQNHTKVLFVK